MNIPSTSTDLILHNGTVTTLDRSNPIATAVAIRNGEFLRVGTEADVMPLAGAATRVIDLEGRRVLPGLIDNHLSLPPGTSSRAVGRPGTCDFRSVLTGSGRGQRVAREALAPGVDVEQHRFEAPTERGERVLHLWWHFPVSAPAQHAVRLQLAKLLRGGVPSLAIWR